MAFVGSVQLHYEGHDLVQNFSVSEANELRSVGGLIDIVETKS